MVWWQEESFPSRKNFPGKMKPKKKNDIEQMGLLKKKVKILGDGIKVALSLSLSLHTLLSLSLCRRKEREESITMCSLFFQSQQLLHCSILFFVTQLKKKYLLFCLKFRLSRKRNQQEKVLFVEPAVRSLSPFLSLLCVF